MVGGGGAEKLQFSIMSADGAMQFNKQPVCCAAGCIWLQQAGAHYIYKDSDLNQCDHHV